MGRQADRQSKRRMAKEELRVRRIVESECDDMSEERQKDLIDKIVQRNTTSPIQYASDGLAVAIRSNAEGIAAELDKMNYDTVVLHDQRQIGTIYGLRDTMLADRDEGEIEIVMDGAKECWSDGRVTIHEYEQHGVTRLRVHCPADGVTIKNILDIRDHFGDNFDVLLQISANSDDPTLALINLIPNPGAICGHGREGHCPHCHGQ